MKHKVANALRRKVRLFSLKDNQVVGFDKIIEMYEHCSDFSKIYRQVLYGPSPSKNYFNIINGDLL